MTQVFHKGEIVHVTAGYYSEAHTLVTGIALRDFDETDFEPYFQANPDKEEGFSGYRFAHWLVTSGFISETKSAELHIGGGHDYSPKRRGP